MTLPGVPQSPQYNVVMFSFPGVETADRVLKLLKAEDRLQGCEIEADAHLSRDANGRIHLHERGAAGVGASFGAATAGIIGLVTGPVVFLLILLGGVLGGVAGHIAGKVLPQDDLREVAERLQPDSSAYLAVVDAAHADLIVREFAAEGASVLNIPVETELASAIREGITHHVTRV